MRRRSIAAASTALVEHGRGFQVTNSHGDVELPREADDAAEALRIADSRMYDSKDRRRASAHRQVRDALVQMLAEREPDLSPHLHGVANLVTAVARHLELDNEAVDEVVRGAELHDIGKVAIPDAILHKAGPLSEAERAFVEEHTIVGERILLAAPALAPVAALVRASHERWDGRGYPDGLSGEAIPIGARIIAVCDAYDAIRSDRPYRAAQGHRAAMSALLEASGTQFDPRVVAAFCAVVPAELEDDPPAPRPERRDAPAAPADRHADSPSRGPDAARPPRRVGFARSAAGSGGSVASREQQKAEARADARAPTRPPRRRKAQPQATPADPRRRTRRRGRDRRRRGADLAVG